jgi:hypothetical protein
VRARAAPSRRLVDLGRVGDEIGAARAVGREVGLIFREQRATLISLYPHAAGAVARGGPRSVVAKSE